MNEANQEPRKTATIVTTTGGGTFYSADCPYCKRSMPVGRDLSIMFSCCNNCSMSFDLRYPETNEFLSKMRGKEVPSRIQADERRDEQLTTTDGQPKKDDGSNTPFNPPPAKPFMKDYPLGDPRRGPQNWPVG